MRSLEDSCIGLKELSDFSKKVIDFVVLSLDKVSNNFLKSSLVQSNKTHTRSSASKFFQHLCNRLIEVGAETE